jgi:hypothetical protein
MDNNMDGAGDDDDTESPDTRHDCEACACRDSACPCLLCCFAAVDKLTAENLIMGHTSSHGTWKSRNRRTSSLHIGRRRFSATQDDRDIILERSLSPDNPFGRTISVPPLRKCDSLDPLRSFLLSHDPRHLRRCGSCSRPASTRLGSVCA